jgi:hypothetical protein
MSHDRTHRLIRAAAAGAVVVALPLASGCGNDGSQAEPAAAAKPAAAKVDLGEKPYEITCRDLADKQAADWSRRATVTLANETKIRKLTLAQATQSIFFAMTELCKQNNGAYKPAQDAVAAVKRGKYQAGLGTP